MNSSALTYAIVFPENETMAEAPTIFFEIRTRSKSGHILSLVSFLSLQIFQDIITFYIDQSELWLRNQGASLRVRAPVTDGDWHRISLSEGRITVDDQRFALGEGSTMPALGQASRLTIGMVAGQHSFEGCLHHLSIGQMPNVSFFDAITAGSQLDTAAAWAVQHRSKVISDFLLMSQVQAGECSSAELCGVADPCLNEALCVDLWNKRECRCRAGFEGDFCEAKTNHCEHQRCQHGYCLPMLGHAV